MLRLPFVAAPGPGAPEGSAQKEERSDDAGAEGRALGEQGRDTTTQGVVYAEVRRRSFQTWVVLPCRRRMFGTGGTRGPGGLDEASVVLQRQPSRV